MRTLPRPLRVFLIVLAAATASCLAMEAFWRRVQHRPNPYRWPLVAQGSAFSDLIVFQQRFHSFHSPAFFSFPGLPYTYPAPVAFLYGFFFQFPNPKMAFVIVFLLIVVLAFSFAARTLLRAGLRTGQVAVLLGVTLLCAYPLFFELEQGNMEALIAVLTGLAILFFLRGQNYLSATLVGIAGAMKLFPFLLVGLFIARRKYRWALWSFLTGGALNGFALWAVCPDIGIAWRGIRSGLGAFRTDYILRYAAFGFDHSFFTLPKLYLLLAHGSFSGRPEPSAMILAHALTQYFVVAGVVASLLYWFVMRRRPVINQIIFLTVCSITLPPVSYDYTLIHLYAPWLCLVLALLETKSHGISSSNLVVVFILFGLALGPQSELIVRGQPLGGEFKAIVLVGILLWAVLCPLQSGFDSIPESHEAVS